MANTPFENRELKLARDFVQYTGSHIFLTGKAGTGKTTFRRNLKKNSHKRMIITAPTGVAAINAGGVTLHSFFQLPFGPFIPESDIHERNRQRLFRFNKEKKRIIKSLDLLVIDEISMVRADLLDAVDAVLRRHRRNGEPFGGVQLLMIGDLHQLPPVAKPDEWQLLRRHYSSVYFFSSHALGGRTEMMTIELNHIYSQSDARFINLLNRVRDNRLDAAAIEELNQRYIKNFTPEQDQEYITLTTHNRYADTINKTRLAALAGKEYCFEAEISGDFPEHMYPTLATLVFKKGAQVMFMRNDPSAEKRYYNGKIGTIKAISGGQIRYQGCPIWAGCARWPENTFLWSVKNSNGSCAPFLKSKIFRNPIPISWNGSAKHPNGSRANSPQFSMILCKRFRWRPTIKNWAKRSATFYTISKRKSR